MFMPELPEVETIKRDLSKRILSQKIRLVEIRDKKVVTSNNFVKQLIGNEVKDIERRGKLLIFVLKNKEYLLVHLKMTGQLMFKAKSKSDNVIGGHSLSKMEDNFSEKFTRVIIDFGVGKLFFNDMRRFGYMKIVKREEKEKIVNKDFGIEPLTPDFTWKNFNGLFGKRTTSIKAFLLNQKIIAGLGNIYTDEACFCAGIKPSRPVSDLSLEEIKKLFKCIPKILQLAIKNRGTTFNSFVDADGRQGSHFNFLKVYGRHKEKCKRCSEKIKKIRLVGRGTHFCPGCQK